MTPYRIETARLVLRCYDPLDAPFLKDAVERSLDHLRPWMPWTPAQPEPLDEVVERLRAFRAQYDRDENWIMRIVVRVDPANERSDRVPAKLGFAKEATLRRRLPGIGGSELRDTNTWVLFRDELAGSRCLDFEYVAYDALGRTITPSPSA